MPGTEVTVLGAGVVGFSTAVNIQRCVPEADVKIIADGFYDDTTSYGSGGIFLPTIDVEALTQSYIDKVRKWCSNSWQFYSSLAIGSEAGHCGAVITTGYSLFNSGTYIEQLQDLLYKDFIFSCERLSQKEMGDLGFTPLYKFGVKATTIVLDQRKYLLWLQKRFIEKGGRIEKRRIKSINEFVGQCDVLVNCCGYGSRELLGDTNMYAARGQVVRVKAPWIKHWILTDDVTYIIPGENYVVLGGVKQVGNESQEVVTRETDGILWRCRRLVPSLEAAEVDHSWAGLRPCRDEVRVEKETITVGDTSLQVVHNYGHGSDGVALSWGTSVEAADLVKKALQCRQNIGSKL